MSAHMREGHHFAKLDGLAVMDMRLRYADGAVTQETLALEYDVSPGTIWAALHGVTWGPEHAVPVTPRGTTHCPRSHPYSDTNTRWTRIPRTGGWGKKCCTCTGARPRTKEDA